MQKLFLFFLFIQILFSCRPSENSEKAKVQQEIKNNQEGFVIAFGSCNHQERKQVLWDPIIDNNPDLWVWLGDNIYGDTHDMDLMQEKYNKQKSNQGYQQLMSKVPVIGTWDDHDYGINDGGENYSKKEQSKQLMLNFLNEPEDSKRRDREGAYASYDFGEGENLIKIILLDTRYFRDTLLPDRNSDNLYLPNTEGTMLGEKQWQWLEEELKSSKAALNIIGSSIQVLSEEHAWEKWANFPNERKRLLDLVAESGAEGVIFISGDRHIAEISKISYEDMNYPLYDFTSSGLTHTWRNAREEKNSHRVGEMIIALNFGIIDIDWKEEGPLVTFEVKGNNNETHLTEQVQY